MRIRPLREQLEIKQYELAARTGIPPYRVSFIERGLIEPRPRELKLLAKALGVTVEELAGGGQADA